MSKLKMFDVVRLVRAVEWRVIDGNVKKIRKDCVPTYGAPYTVDEVIYRPDAGFFITLLEFRHSKIQPEMPDRLFERVMPAAVHAELVEILRDIHVI